MPSSLALHALDRLKNLLPIESDFSTYLEVEKEMIFVNTRLTLFSISIYHDFETVVSEATKILDHILLKENSTFFSPDGLNSLIILMRLLSDVAEVTWITHENKIKGFEEVTENHYEKEYPYAKYTIGFAASGVYIHNSQPKPMSLHLANKVIKVISRIKSTHKILRLLKGATDGVYGSFVFSVQSKLFEEAQNEMKNSEKNRFLIDMLDRNCEYILKYVAASNPQPFQNFINLKIISPLLVSHVHSDAEIVLCFDYFSFIFITLENLSIFLELLSKVLNRMKKTVYLEILLLFASKTLRSWILGRPAEYLKLLEYIKSKPLDFKITSIIKESNFLFEEIYSIFNVSSILTSTQGLPPETSNCILSGTSLSSGLPYLNAPKDSEQLIDHGFTSTNSIDADLNYCKFNFNSKAFDIKDPIENRAHMSILTFLSIMSMLNPDAFEEVNGTSFKNIPDDPILPDDDYIKDRSDAASNSTTSTNISDEFKSHHLPSRSKKLHSLKLLANFSSGNKKVKFLTTLLKNINGSQQVSDCSLLETIRSLVSISRLSAPISVHDRDSPVVYFTRRLFTVLCDCLQLGNDKDSKKYPIILRCLSKYPGSHCKLQVDYFPVGCTIAPDIFVLRLTDYIIAKGYGLPHLHMITEGFKLFFKFHVDYPTREQVMLRVTDFLRRTAYEMSNIILIAFPYFEDKVSNIVDEILEGALVNDTDVSKIPLDRSPSLSPSPAFLSSFIPRSSPKQPCPSPSSSSSVSSFLSSKNNKHSSVVLPSRNDIVSPHPRRASSSSNSAAVLRTPLFSVSPILTDKPQQVTRSTLEKNIISGLKLVTRLRRESQDSSSSFDKTSSIRLDSNVNIERKTTLGALDIARATLVNIFTIYKGMIKYYIISYDPHEPSSNLCVNYKHMVKPLFVAFVEEHPLVHDAGILFAGLCTDYFRSIKEHDNDALNIIGYVCSGYLVTLLSAVLFNLSLSESRRELFLRLLNMYWDFHLSIPKLYLQENCLEVLRVAENIIFPLIRGSSGRALFACLYSHEITVQKMLKIGFKQFSQELEFHELIAGFPAGTEKYNKEFIDAMCRDNYIATGSIAFQRRLRTDILKYMKYPDRILYDTVELIYSRWHVMAMKKNLTPTELCHFRNYAGFLASSCGVFMTIDTELIEAFAYLSEARSTMLDRIDYFIFKQCHWIDNEDLLTRENSKDIISTELHPLAFKTLFKHLKLRIKELEGVNLTKPDNELLFTLLEQVILILRIIIERDDDTDLLIIISLELLELTEDILKIIEQLPKDSTKYYKGIIYMSKFFRSFEHSETVLCISGYLLLKNKWLRLVMQWFESSIFKEYDLGNLTKSHREMDLVRRDTDYLYIDTAIESSKALAYLTKNVVLEVPQSMSEKEFMRSKEVVFGNYFNILLKGLEKGSGTDKFPHTLRHKIGLLNENIITSLTNILSSNGDVGLKYALPIGYSSNKNIRLAFLKVFVNIVSKFDINKAKVFQERNEAIEKVSLEAINELKLISWVARVCPANEIDSLASSLLSLFEIKNVAHLIVTELIRDEINRANRYMDVLRRNSCATRTLSMFSRLKGTDYLIKVLKPVLEELITSHESFEVEKIELDHPDRERNVHLFVKYMTKLTDSIVNSLDIFPPEFIIICQTIYDSVKKNFPDYAGIAVGSFMFLRFFCPALVSADAEGIVDSLSPKEKRSFMILAKVIQNIANGSVGSIKWPLLKTKTDFLRQISDRIFEYLSNISSPDHQPNIVPNITRKATTKEIKFIHKFLYYHGLEIRAELLGDIRSLEDFNTLKRAAYYADNFLSLLGQPEMDFKNEIPPSVREKIDTNSQLYEFMSRQSLKLTDLPEDCHYAHESVFRDGYPVFVFTWHLYRQLEADFDTLVYRLFRVYSKIWSNKHYLVADYTGSNEQNDDRTELKRLLSFFLKLVPSEASSNCLGVYYVNCIESHVDSWFGIMRAWNPYLNTSHHFINSNSSPKVMKSLGLADYSYEVYNDIRITLHDASLHDPKKGRFTPITLKIGNKYFQIIHDTPRRLKVENTDDVLEVYYNEVYEILEIKETYISNETSVPSEFTIELQNSKIVLTSPKYLEILKTFYYFKLRVEDEYREVETLDPGLVIKTNKEQRERADIIGHILLTVFIALNSDDDALRAVAYNLLAVTQDTFGLDFGHTLHQSPEVHIPDDNSPFCISIMKGLAASSPELSNCVWNYFLDGLEGIVDESLIPNLICCMSSWAENIYQSIYIANEEQGHELTSKIISRLIKLTVRQERYSNLYSQYIWSCLLLDANLTEIIVEEIINHSSDRDSEGSDWKKAISILTRIPTAEICGSILSRIMDITKSFLPSLKLETSTNSWSELIILVNTAVALFFDSLLLSKLYLPEVLYVVSLLIDVGPTELRSVLHNLLMNICQSLANSDSLPARNKANLEEICSIFSRQKLKFMFVFSQEKGCVLQNFNVTSFLTKFTTLEYFVNNIVSLMDHGSVTDSIQWKTKFNKYLMDTVFNSISFLSARAIMILGIISKSGISDVMCRSLLQETMKVVSRPTVTDQGLFFLISHAFTYSKIVEGISPDSHLHPQLFWLSSTLVQSTNIMLYQGGLLFMTSSIERISIAKMESYVPGYSNLPLINFLFNHRDFGDTILQRFDKTTGVEWSTENFPHVVLFFISRGLLIPYIRTSSIESLIAFFKIFYYETLYDAETCFYPYMFFIFILQRPSNYVRLMEEVDLTSQMINLDDHIKVNAELLKWLESDTCQSNIVLVQASIYFSTSVSDEASKYRFLLVVRYLARKSPGILFKFYPFIQVELRRVTTYNFANEFIEIAFDIIKLAVVQKNYTKLDTFKNEMVQLLNGRGLQGIHNLLFNGSGSSSISEIKENSQIIYDRKRLIVMLLAKMTN